jgi:glycoside/pentoside/hexuronide:cation symporter, GPH family
MDTEKLSLRTKLAYGSGDLGTAISAALRAFFLLIFLTDVARLSPVAAGSVLLIIRVWDAVNDPLIGWLSDRTVSRWGRRRPWILYAAVPFGVTFFLIWLVPPLDHTGRFIYYAVVALLLDTFYSMVNVPYTALTPELSRDYDERTSLNSYRFAFSVGGALISVVLHPIIVAQFDAPETGYMVSAALWAVVTTIPCFVVVAGTRERPESIETAQQTPIPSIQQVRIALSNRPYRYVIGIYLCSWLALQLTSTVLVYYLTYYLRVPEQIPLVLLALQTTTLVFLFVWGAISRRLDKRWVFILGSTIWVAVQLWLFFLQPEQTQWIIPIAILAGTGVAVAYLIPWAMMPDVIEYDEWETGQRREGIFYGLMVFLQKIGLAIAVFMVGQALEWSGYITPEDTSVLTVQPESALTALRIIIGPIPALIILVGVVLVYYYPITRATHAEMVAALRRRRADQSG